MYRNIITDMDDTLLPCGPFYSKVQHEFATFQNERTGLAYDVCLNILKGIDLACVTLPNAFNRERFPRSFRAASFAIDITAGRRISYKAAQRAYDIGNSVFDAPYDVFAGVLELLVDYKNDGYRLFLLTKGDEEIQLAKIKRNALEQVFDSASIYIVPKKTGDCIQQIIDQHALHPSETIMVGDSLRDDIGSAVEAGIDSVWVHKNANKSWAYENTGNSIQPTHTIDLFTDLSTIL